MRKNILPPQWFQSKNTVDIARQLIGKFLVVKTQEGDRAYMITETEAYDGFADKASHAHRGQTFRNKVMFASGGRLYIYFVYGMHWMTNIVTGPESYPGAVLIRGVIGISGPGRVSKELGFDGVFNNTPLKKSTKVWIEDRHINIPKNLVTRTSRIGVSYAGSWAKKPYRFLLKNNDWIWGGAAEALCRGDIAVIPTDTVYGIVASALHKKSVERIYALRQRQPQKPCIILIDSVARLKHFNVTISQEDRDVIQSVWPGPVSIVFPCMERRFSYLHRGTNTLAFRIPDDPNLLKLLKKTGPLIAPSANKEGFPTVENIKDAITVFGDLVPWYVDGGKRQGLPSTVISLSHGLVTIIRQGKYRLAKNQKHHT